MYRNFDKCTHMQLKRNCVCIIGYLNGFKLEFLMVLTENFEKKIIQFTQVTEHISNSRKV